VATRARSKRLLSSRQSKARVLKVAKKRCGHECKGPIFRIRLNGQRTHLERSKALNSASPSLSLIRWNEEYLMPRACVEQCQSFLMWSARDQDDRHHDDCSGHHDHFSISQPALQPSALSIQLVPQTYQQKKVARTQNHTLDWWERRIDLMHLTRTHLRLSYVGFNSRNREHS
jgi:hypothetical protein